MNILRATNKQLGSLVNRVNIMALYAAKGANVSRREFEKRDQSFISQINLRVKQWSSTLHFRFGYRDPIHSIVPLLMPFQI